ncbi:MAG: hypothetical protein DPW09_42700 [Anaerolineae bacterium]|nr:hypothetical protein [Anaerolineae bacterium]
MSYVKRAAIYARVSNEHQAGEDRDSIEAQLVDCEAYCQGRGYVVVVHYVDKERYRSKGKLVQPSGQRKDRPQYVAMLKAAQAREFDVIIAWKEDRLYRGMYVAMPFAEVLDEMDKRLEVELVKDPFDRKMLGIKAALGKIEVDNIKERMDMGRCARLEKGEMLGSLRQLRYGYKKVSVTWKSRNLKPRSFTQSTVGTLPEKTIWKSGAGSMRWGCHPVGARCDPKRRWNESSPVKLTPPANYALGWEASRLTSLARRLFRWLPGRKPRRSEPAIATSHAGSRKITYVLGGLLRMWLEM